MDRAREEGVAVPMFAGSMGQRLYSKHGFKELGTVHVQVDGEEEEIFLSSIAWDPKDEKQKEAEKAKENDNKKTGLRSWFAFW